MTDTDIVERLRARTQHAGNIDHFGHLELMREALVEIERLMEIVVEIGRDKDQEIERLRATLAFAASTIKSGEPWTDRCDEVIGRALKQDKPWQHTAPRDIKLFRENLESSGHGPAKDKS